MTLALVIIGGYLLGSIPFSYLAGKVVKGIDLREHGSGNLGASNTFRILGARAGAVVLVLDVAKGFFPVFFAGKLAASAGVPVYWYTVAAAVAAVMGHMFSVYLRFGGGKGVATSGGAYLALSPIAVVCAFVVWLTVFATKRIVSLASLSAAVALPAAVYLVDRFDLWPSHWSYTVVTVVVSLVVIFKHRGNIRRLMSGSEPALARRRSA